MSGEWNKFPWWEVGPSENSSRLSCWEGSQAKHAYKCASKYAAPKNVGIEIFCTEIRTLRPKSHCVCRLFLETGFRCQNKQTEIGARSIQQKDFLQKVQRCAFEGRKQMRCFGLEIYEPNLPYLLLQPEMYCACLCYLQFLSSIFLPYCPASSSSLSSTSLT